MCAVDVYRKYQALAPEVVGRATRARPSWHAIDAVFVVHLLRVADGYTA